MNEETLWDDLKDQITKWLNNGCIGNNYTGRAYNTGYGGPYQGNVTVTRRVFDAVLERLRDHKRQTDALTHFSVNGPPSTSVTDGHDFVLQNGPDTKRFVYHVIISG
ncbi:hypothetical protein A7982_13667 [Minicystis rosea]|nr:hypothetical protein A7982_13667 [Minicystis rosea]